MCLNMSTVSIGLELGLVQQSKCCSDSMELCRKKEREREIARERERVDE